jgi:nitrate reductase delta subunit
MPKSITDPFPAERPSPQSSPASGESEARGAEPGERERPFLMTLRVFAHLLSYPTATLREHLPEMRDVLHSEAALTTTRLAELDELMHTLAHGDEIAIEENYVDLFDRGRATSLHLFEHVHGDSRDRGPAMIDLAQTYEKAGLYLAPDELPDYLPAVLEFVSTLPTAEARSFLGEMAHILNVIFAALQQRQSGYAGILASLLELAGETVQPVKPVEEQALDASWEEPLVFGGCNAQGQAKPNQPQPINIVRKGASTQEAST